MAQPNKINKELKKLNIDGSIYRGKGYYYFIGCLFDIVPSIYANSLSGWTTKQIIDHVQKYYKPILKHSL